MPVRARLSRYRASLLDKKPLPPPSPRKAWSWSAGSEVDELALLEAQQYLAGDHDVEAVFLDIAHYDASGMRKWAGMWGSSDEVYRPEEVIKQARYVKLPYVAVTVAIPGQWLDTAIKLKSGATKTGHRLVPVARKGYKLAREQVRKHRPPQDRVSTHTAQVRLGFETEPGHWEALRAQLDKAGVLMTEQELAALKKTVEAAGVWNENNRLFSEGLGERSPWLFKEKTSEEPPPTPAPPLDVWGCMKLARSKVRVAGPDGVMHLAELSMVPPKVFCGAMIGRTAGLTPSNRGSVWALPGELPPSNGALLCPYCLRIASQAAPATEVDVNSGLANEQAWIPDEEKRETLGEQVAGALAVYDAGLKRCPACGRISGTEGVSCYRTHAEGWVCERATDEQEAPDFEALRPTSRVLAQDGVLHLTDEPFPAALAAVVSRCGSTLDIGPVRYFQALAKRGDPTPEGAKSICPECLSAARMQDVRPWPESIAQEEQIAALRDRARLVDVEGVMHLARLLMVDPEQLQKSRTRCDPGKSLADDERRFQSGAFPDDPTPAGAVSVCLDCVNGKSPAVKA